MSIQENWPAEKTAVPEHNAVSASSENSEIDSEKMESYLKTYRENREKMIESALLAITVSQSWRQPRPFKVGAVAMSVRRETPDSKAPLFTSGANFTPERISAEQRQADREKGEAWRKSCGERNAISAALREGNDFIVGLLTVSPELDTGDGSKTDEVLHLCKDCRDLLRTLRTAGQISDGSLITNVHVDNAEHPDLGKQRIQEMKVKDYLELYADDSIVIDRNTNAPRKDMYG